MKLSLFPGLWLVREPSYRSAPRKCFFPYLETNRARSYYVEEKWTFFELSLVLFQFCFLFCFLFVIIEALHLECDFVFKLFSKSVLINWGKSVASLQRFKMGVSKLEEKKDEHHQHKSAWFQFMKVRQMHTYNPPSILTNQITN